MKKLLLSLVVFCILHTTFSQFGQDIIITDSANVNQQKVVISTAFNGWIYSAFTTVNSSGYGGITIQRSIDKGVTWQSIDSYSIPGIRYEDVEIVAAGSDSSSLVLFVAGINHDTTLNSYVAFIDRYNGVTGGFMGSVFNRSTGVSRIYDLALVSDYEMPGVGTSPYSVAILMSRFGSTYDSVTCDISIDGGANFTVHSPVAATGNYFGKVALAYGRSNSGSNGRYFAAWERKSSINSRNGHIYTSRTASNVVSSFLTPICLDSLSSTMINLCRNPRIATQYNNTDNDSGSVTAVVLVDRDYNGDASDYDLLGFYNKRAHFTNFWYRLDVNNSGENSMQSDIVYDIDSSKFRATYFDSTAKKLLYIENGINLTTPGNWTTVNSMYNDTAPATNPFPRLSVSRVEGGVGAVWTKAGTGTNGVAMFDANYTVVFAGLDDNNQFDFEIAAYPNPTTDQLYIDLQNIDQVNLQLLNGNGQVIEIRNMVTDQQILSLGGMPSGIYFLRMEYKGQVVTKKIIKQ